MEGTGNLSGQGVLTAGGGLMVQLDVIPVGGRGDWPSANHPSKQYFLKMLNGKPRGTFLRALSDHVDWQGHCWNGWVDNNLQVRVADNYFNTKATADNNLGVVQEIDTMHDQLQSRLDTLRKELELRQQRLQELEHEQGRVRDTMLRISGAIQVLEEMQKETTPASEASVQGKNAHDRAATGADTQKKGV